MFESVNSHKSQSVSIIRTIEAHSRLIKDYVKSIDKACEELKGNTDYLSTGIARGIKSLKEISDYLVLESDKVKTDKEV